MNLQGMIEIVELTNVGRVRDHNEDYIITDVSRGVAILADGMGGMNAGAVASAMSAHVILEELVEFVDGASTLQTEGADGGNDEGLELQVLKSTIEKANSSVFHVSQTQPQCRGMGTTIVTALFFEEKVVVGHIGDSRMYLYRQNELKQITKDHSFVQDLIDKGLYTVEEARASSQKNVVTRAVGIAPSVEVEINEFSTEQDDLYLMCSDGLSDLVTDADIEKVIVLFGKDIKGMANQLVELANASGGKDNISIVLIKVLKNYRQKDGLIKRVLNWFE